MSKPKSIFIVDTPESINGEPPCYYCPLYQTDSDYYYQSYICQNITNEIEDNDNNMWEIYKNCPLKPHQKAIPVEWIEKFMDRFRLGMVTSDEYALLHFMLTEWEKENE